MSAGRPQMMHLALKFMPSFNSTHIHFKYQVSTTTSLAITEVTSPLMTGCLPHRVDLHRILSTVNPFRDKLRVPEGPLIKSGSQQWPHPRTVVPVYVRPILSLVEQPWCWQTRQQALKASLKLCNEEINMYCHAGDAAA